MSFWSKLKFWEKKEEAFTELQKDELYPGTYDLLFEEVDIKEAIDKTFFKPFYNQGKELVIVGIRNEDGFTKVRVTVPNPFPIILYAVVAGIISVFGFLTIRLTFKGIERITTSPVGILGATLLIFYLFKKAKKG